MLAVYVADADDHVLITANATEPGSCMASSELLELTPDQLDDLAPDLLALIARSPLPT